MLVVAAGAGPGRQPVRRIRASGPRCAGNGGIAAGNNTYFTSDQCIQDMQCGSLYGDVIGGPGKLIAHSDTDGIYEPVLSGEHVYWNNEVRIVRSNLDGGDQTVIAELDEPTVDSSIHDFAIDDAYVYWASPFGIWRSPK